MQNTSGKVPRRFPNFITNAHIETFRLLSLPTSDMYTISNAHLCIYLLCYHFRLSLTTASSQRLATPNVSAQAPPLPLDPKRFPSIVAQATRNHSLQIYGCYGPAPGLSYVTAQDGIIALGEIAHSQGFYQVRSWNAPAVLAEWNTAAIYLAKIGMGTDFFSLYQVAVQAMDILWQCVMFSHEPYGGALPIGGRDVFRVVVQS